MILSTCKDNLNSTVISRPKMWGKAAIISGRSRDQRFPAWWHGCCPVSSPWCMERGLHDDWFCSSNNHVGCTEI